MQDPYAPPGQAPSAPNALPASSFTGGSPPGVEEDVLGWVGVGLGAVSWLACCCSIIPFVGAIIQLVAMLMAVGAVVCGALSYRNASRSGGSPVLGILGMVFGGVRIALVIAAIIIVIIMLALGMGAGLMEALAQGAGR